MAAEAQQPVGAFGGQYGGGAGGPVVLEPPPSDQADLAAFITDLRALLDWLVRESGWLPGEQAALYADALDGVQPQFELVLAQLAQPAIVDHLAVVGLTGVSLQLKTDLYVAARALDARDRDYVDTAARPTQGKWASIFGKVPIFAAAARVALKGANHVLGSLLGLPGVHILDEMKQVVELGIDLKEYVAEPETPPSP